MQTIVVVTALIKNPPRDKFLIVKRKPSSKIHPNKWVFPGGKVNKKEDIITALKREVKEETNLEIEIIKKISEYEYTRPDKNITFGLCYETIANTEDIALSSELSNFKWILPQDFNKYPHFKELDKEIEKVFGKKMPGNV